MMRRVTPHDIPAGDPAQGAWVLRRTIFARDEDGYPYRDPDVQYVFKRVRAWFGLTNQPLPRSLRCRA